LKYVDSEKQTRVNGVSFSVRAGEIVGIAGVEGNGQNELIEMITGLSVPTEGQIEMMGKSIAGRGIGELRNLGMAYIPSDRMALGVASTMSIEENLITTKIKKKLLYNKFKLMDLTKINRLSAKLVEELPDQMQFRPDSCGNAVPAGTFKRLLSPENSLRKIHA
jgi:simple sugar transport system ATP-binding protein